MTKVTSKPSLFLISFVLFHILLFLMRQEDQVFWHMMTGIFLLTTFSYLLYKRHLTSRRIGQSLLASLIASVAIVVLYTVLVQFLPAISYEAIMTTLISIGVHYRWQLMISLAVTVPLHELYFRTMLQEQMTNPVLAVILTSLASVSLFIWVLSVQQLITLVGIQLITAAAFQYSKRLITPIAATICATIILILFYA
ncbi:CPBP family glutamic-type intramembrane protease [Macrococcus bovicus]|uniref:CAAX prenyl protease 2/Lysostaphin resistance protein A-like domain-containing protein n=2 Tax=Macrococcus TaxID=69965 RepID=A0A4R6C153_9STAP|nr:CPBP family glutamic-type intramembrane protease [Macrococcus bovicus]TDM14893.1 hypothetical protein ERX55_02840 [Macrococcus bovicus]